MSAGTLLGTPAGQGLFHGAIAQSGACHHVHTGDVAEWVTDGFLDALDLSPSAAEAVLSAPVEDVLRAQAAIETRVQTDTRRTDGPAIGALTFQPVIDGALLPGPPLDAVRAGSARGVNLVAGTTADEWNLFHLRDRLGGPLTEDRATRRLARLVGADRVADLVDVYRTARPHATPDDLVCAVMTDHVFRVPAVRLAEAQVPHAPQVSLYRFDLPSTAMGGALGACHAIEVPFVFDNLDRGGVEVLLGGVDDGARALANRVSRAWTGVAHTGRPAHDDLPWPRYDLDQRLACVLDREVRTAPDLEPDVRALWDELAPVGAATGS